MDENSTTGQHGESEQKKGRQALSGIQRRVAGVLVEKAKTTPDAYPMTLNAICSACNQKSNRSPVMNLEPEDVEEALGQLRSMGAVGLVEGYGRVPKFRHYLYEWLEVDKVELAVMAELLLRGAQTMGELRGRAARMEPIPDLQALRPVVDSLKAKELIVPLTPEGRGHVVTHNLYPPGELSRLREKHGSSDTRSGPAPKSARPASHANATEEACLVKPSVVPEGELAALRGDVDLLRTQVDELSQAVEVARRELNSLKQQLGA